MWEARDKIVFIVRSEGKCTYYTEVGFEMHNIAFLLLLTDQDVMIDVCLHLESDKVLTNLEKTRPIQLYSLAAKEGKYWIQNNTGIPVLSCSFYVLKFSVHNVFFVMIAMSLYSFDRGTGD